MAWLWSGNCGATRWWLTNQREEGEGRQEESDGKARMIMGGKWGEENWAMGEGEGQGYRRRETRHWEEFGEVDGFRCVGEGVGEGRATRWRNGRNGATTGSVKGDLGGGEEEDGWTMEREWRGRTG